MSPARLYLPDAPAEFLSREACKALFDRIAAMSVGGGSTSVSIVSSWRGTSTWARNRVYVSSDNHDVEVYVSRTIQGAGSSASTTRTDDDGLRQAVREAERSRTYGGQSPENLPVPLIQDTLTQPTLWSEATMALSPDGRADLARRMIAPSEGGSFLSAGEIVAGAQGRAMFSTEGMARYYPTTFVEVSASVRDPKRGASGWAGVTDFDLARVDGAAIATRATEKARLSASPVALEPGRYTVILEPQAVADLFSLVIRRVMDRQLAESGRGPFADPSGSKIGMQVLDRRLTVSADPMDPLAGFVPFEIYSGDGYRQVNWMDQGILRDLSYYRGYALGTLGLDKPLLNSNSYRMFASGEPTVSIDDMIASTQRGLVVTRFGNVEVIDMNSMLLSGFTRDGVWLVESGKISKAVKNFRFTESPLFALNNVQQIGAPVRVFDRTAAVLVPPIKVQDFSMTALADAV